MVDAGTGINRTLYSGFHVKAPEQIGRLLAIKSLTPTMPRRSRGRDGAREVDSDAAAGWKAKPQHRKTRYVNCVLRLLLSGLLAGRTCVLIRKSEPDEYYACRSIQAFALRTANDSAVCFSAMAPTM